MHEGVGLKRDNHFLPVCYQKGFAVPSGRVWVKFVHQRKAVHWYPSRVGKERNMYISSMGGVEDDKFEDFFSKEVENDFARLSQRVKREQNKLADLSGKEQGALLKFVASQIVRTLANKQSMKVQVGRPLSTTEFLLKMVKQWKVILRSWQTDRPSLDFYTPLPSVGERFITGDDPVLLVVENNNPIWIPGDEPQRRIASPQAVLNNPGTSFRVALSPYICVFLRVQGGGEALLPPQTMKPSAVRSFNDLIRKQCQLFTLAMDKESLP